MRHRMFIWGLILTSAVPAWLPGRAAAQRLKADVNLHDERLAADERDYLAGIDQQLARALDAADWGAVKYPYEFPVRVEILLEGASRRSATYRNYTAGVMVASKSGMQLRDSRWDFQINRDVPLHVGQPYDTFTGLVEFYVWLCIGLERDLIDPAGGQTCYDRALSVAQGGLFEVQFSDGWDIRRDFARDLAQDTTYLNVRKAAYYAKVGDYLLRRDEVEKAGPYLDEAVRLILMGSPKMVELKRDDHIVRFVDMEQLVFDLNRLSKTVQIDRLARWDTARDEIYR